jgi:hypothetical protein
MLDIFEYVLSDYIDDKDKITLLCGKTIEDFNLPLNMLNIDVHFKNDYALRIACVNNSISIVEFLVSKGADIQCL